MPNWAHDPIDQERPTVAGQVGRTGSTTLPRNCSAEDDVPEPVPGLGAAVDERRPERAGPERQLEVDEDDRRDDRRRRTSATSRVFRQVARSTARTNRAIGGRQQQGQRVVADGQAEDDARRTSERSARPATSPRVRASQATSRRSSTATNTQVEGVGLGVGPDRPGDAASVPARARRGSPRMAERVRTRTRSTVIPAASATHRPASRFIRNAGSPNGWRTTEANQPSRT